MASRHNKGSITWTELLIISAILLLVGRIVLAILFGKQIHDWESRLWSSLGIDPWIGRGVVGIFGIFIALGTAIQKSKKRH